MTIELDAEEAHTAGYSLRDAEFTRTVLVTQSCLFFYLAFDLHVGAGLIFGCILVGLFMYWHFHEIPRRRAAYDAAQRKFLSAVWANRLPHNNG